MKDHRLARHQEPTERHERIAEALANGAEIQSTMLAEGYNEHQARQGLAGVPKTALVLLLEKTNPDLLEYAALDGASLKSLVIGRLGKNVAEGRDGGVGSAKQLGMLKELSMFQADSLVGVVIINAPGSEETAKLVSGDIECANEMPGTNQNQP